MERISSHQFMMMSAAVLLGTNFNPVAQASAGAAGRDAYWSVFPAVCMAIPWGLMVLVLKKRYPDQNLLQVSSRLMGKWPAKGIAALYLGALGYLGVLLLVQVGDAFRRSVLPLVPTYVILGGMMFLVLMLAWSGVEVFARFTEVVFPLVISGLIFTVLFALPRFEPREYLPLFENGVLPVFWGSVQITPYSMEYILFLAGVLTFIPSGEQGRLKKGLWWAVLTVAFVLSVLTFAEIMVFGPEETKRLNYGLLALGKMIDVARTVSGIESLFMLNWMGAEIAKIAALFLAASWGLEELFGWKKNFIFYIALTSVFMALALPRPGGTAMVLALQRLDLYLILPFGLLWIPLLLGLSSLKRRLKKE